jgi:hypothetical protein
MFGKIYFRESIMKQKTKQLSIGEKTGDWTVTEIIITQHINSNNRFCIKTRYKFQCKCGNSRIDSSSFLTCGFKKHCLDCSIKWERIKEDLRGRKISNWNVIGISRNDKSGRLEWRCICECGFEKNIRDNRLHQNKMISCKQCHSYKDITPKIYFKILKVAQTRNIEFKISPKEMWEIYEEQNFQCYFTKIPISIRYEYGSMGTASLDRKNSNLGYTKENCQWVHKVVNICKHSLDNDEFISMCTLVANSSTCINKNWMVKHSISNKNIGRERREKNVWGLDYSNIPQVK